MNRGEIQIKAVFSLDTPTHVKTDLIDLVDQIALSIVKLGKVNI